MFETFDNIRSRFILSADYDGLLFPPVIFYALQVTVNSFDLPNSDTPSRSIRWFHE